MPPEVFVYIVICLIIGLFGMNRKMGFWGYFFAAMAMTPLVGAILVLASDKRKA